MLKMGSFLALVPGVPLRRRLEQALPAFHRGPGVLERTFLQVVERVVAPPPAHLEKEPVVVVGGAGRGVLEPVHRRRPLIVLARFAIRQGGSRPGKDVDRSERRQLSLADPRVSHLRRKPPYGDRGQIPRAERHRAEDAEDQKVLEVEGKENQTWTERRKREPAPVGRIDEEHSQPEHRDEPNQVKRAPYPADRRTRREEGGPRRKRAALDRAMKENGGDREERGRGVRVEVEMFEVDGLPQERERDADDGRSGRRQSGHSTEIEEGVDEDETRGIEH